MATASNSNSQDPGEELASLNAEVRARRNPSQALRRAMETTLEGKARKERRKQKPASAGFKRTSGA